jgi:hypothetical protein
MAHRFADIAFTPRVAAERHGSRAQCASLPGYEATVERVARIDVVAFDWNCPQHIPPR